MGLFQEDFESGKLGDAAQHLHNAIQIYPENPVAHHNLGICYVRLKEYEKAVAEFEAASALDPRLVQPIISLSGAFFLLGRYPDAEAAARHALDIDPVNTLARYLLGRTLALEGRDTQETVQLLRASSSRFPLARLALVSILVKHNAREEAVAELREYLRQPDAPDKDKVTRMLERLAQPPETSKSPLE